MYVPGGWWHSTVNLEHTAVVAGQATKLSELEILMGEVCQPLEEATTLEQHQKAANGCLSVLERNPRHVLAMFNLAGTYYMMGRYEEAEMSYRRALKINPRYRSTWIQLITAIVHRPPLPTDKPAKAVIKAKGALEEALVHLPKDPTLLELSKELVAELAIAQHGNGADGAQGDL